MKRALVLVASIASIVVCAWCVLATRGVDELRSDVETIREDDGSPIRPTLGSPSLDPSIPQGEARTEVEGLDPMVVSPEAVREKRRVLIVRVIDGETRQPPSESVTVQLTPRRLLGTPAPPAPPIYLDELSISRSTDDEGLASFESPPTGHAVLHVDGLFAWSDRVAVEIETVAESRFELVAWRNATLEGRVHDRNGVPVPGGSVVVLPERKPRSAHNGYVDDQGVFRVDGIVLGEEGSRGLRATVRAQHPEFFDVAESEVTLLPGENEHSAPLVLARRGATVCGRVLGANDRPSANVDVRMQVAADSPPQPRTTRTNQLGEFRFTAVVPGEYVLICAANCHGETPPFEVRESGDLDVGDLRAPPERFDLSGYAYFEDGTPASGAWVTLGSESVELESDGRFAFRTCDRAARDLTFRWEENPHVYWRQIERNAAPGGPSLRIVLTPRGVVFRLIDAETRAPVAGGRLELTATGASASSKFGGWRQAPSEFRFDLDDLDPPWKLRFVVEGYAPFETTLDPPEGGFTKREVMECALIRLK